MPIANAPWGQGRGGTGKWSSVINMNRLPVAAGRQAAGNRQHIVANSFFRFLLALRALAALADFFLLAVID